MMDGALRSLEQLYREHVNIRQQCAEKALHAHNFDGLVIYSGHLESYFLDDQHKPFRSNPHFLHWTPASGPGHYVHIQSGKKPCLYLFTPKDFWYEIPQGGDRIAIDTFAVKTFTDPSSLDAVFKQLKNHAYIGEGYSRAKSFGFHVNPKELLAHLDWDRSLKSAYEIACLEEANKKAADAHKNSRQVFANSGTELEMHQAYLATLCETEEDLPYGSIVACDEKSAILHYQKKRTKNSGQVFLIDAGARYNGYCSDITRTYVRSSVPGVFKDLVKAMESIQQELCLQVCEGAVFYDLHQLCLKKIAKLLVDSGLLLGCSVELALKEDFVRTFLPHGLGHMLGIQVHDVGGSQEDATGKLAKQNIKTKSLRLQRALRAQEVVTIEPGLYFIPMLLDKIRQSSHASYFNWKVLDELIPCGGIRIEDDVVVGRKQCTNLTRKYLGNDYIVS